MGIKIKKTATVEKTKKVGIKMITMQAYKKAIEKKCKLPEENVEYTFIFPGQRYVTYTYCGLNEKGRLILYNVKQKTFSTMSPGWFNALIGKRHQLISKRPIGEKKVEFLVWTTCMR